MRNALTTRPAASALRTAETIALRNLTRARTSGASSAEIARAARRYVEARALAERSVASAQIAPRACVR